MEPNPYQRFDRWYFHDEMGDEYGPYHSERKADRELKLYCRFLDRGPTFWQSIYWPTRAWLMGGYWRIVTIEWHRRWRSGKTILDLTRDHLMIHHGFYSIEWVCAARVDRKRKIKDALRKFVGRSNTPEVREEIAREIEKGEGINL